MGDKRVGDLTIEELKDIIKEVIREMDNTPDKTPFPQGVPDMDRPAVAFYMISSDKDYSGSKTGTKITYTDSSIDWCSSHINDEKKQDND